MEILLPVTTVISLHILALISPGPNFLISAKHGLSYSRHVQLATSTGIATGTLIFTLLGFLGLSAIISQSVTVYTLLKLVGAGYLIYLGLKSFFAEPKAVNIHSGEQDDLGLSRIHAYRIGLLTMLSNPKAAIYFLALFTSVISPDTPLIAKLIIIVFTPCLSWCWYMIVATFFSLNHFRQLYTRFQRPVNRLFGGLMMTLGIGIAFSTRD